MKTKV
jgi:hypothetical protein